MKLTINEARNLLEQERINAKDDRWIEHCIYVGYDKRLEDIKNRYGKDSDIYNKCCKIVDKIRR